MDIWNEVTLSALRLVGRIIRKSVKTQLLVIQARTEKDGLRS